VLLFSNILVQGDFGMESAVDQEHIVYGRNAVLELLREKPDSIEKFIFSSIRPIQS